jgi:hypothetical protein
MSERRAEAERGTAMLVEIEADAYKPGVGGT